MVCLCRKRGRPAGTIQASPISSPENAINNQETFCECVESKTVRVAGNVGAVNAHLSGESHIKPSQLASWPGEGLKEE